MKSSSNELSKCSSIIYQLTHPCVKPFKPEIDCQLVDLSGTSLKKHVCHQCLDTFLFESSLKYHIERRSVKISYFCEKCKSNLNFYNRCALLSHIRSHNQNDEIEVSQVLISPLPLTQLLPEGIAANQTSMYKKNDNSDESNSNSIENKKTCIKSINDKITESIRTDSDSMTNSSISTVNSNKESVKAYSLHKQQNNTNNTNQNNNTIDTSNDPIKKKFVIKKSTNSEIKCSECNISFNSLSSREQHFGQNNQMVLPSNQCKICPLICPTKCSQTVHNRLHSNISNKVCPECGTKFDQLKATDFMTHIIINCLHFSRRLVYECVYCSSRMSSLSAFIQHIKSLHTTQHFQCCQCLFKFETDLKLKEHQTNSHPNDLRRIVIFKCPICEEELKSSNSYLEHISNHQKKLCGFAKFVFVCHQCNQSFKNKNDLKSHLNSFHTENKNQFEKNAFFAKLTEEISRQFRLNVDNDCESSANKLSNQTDRDCSIAKSNNEKRNVSQLNGDQININGRSVKRQMTENSVNNSQTSKRTDIKEDDGSASPQKPTTPKLFKCKECGLTFPVIQTLKRHLILEHRIHDVESYISKMNVEVPVVISEPQLPKEVGEQKLSEILDNVESTDTMCPICSLQFSDSKELKIHGRVHGMAFIKSCQKKTT